MRNLLIIKYVLRDFFLKLMSFRLTFIKPKKNEILIYDKKSLTHAIILFPKKNFTYFATRMENINVYVVLKVLLKKGFKNFYRNYKCLFFNLVEPKIVYTSIDNDQGFYKLKENCYSKAMYISDQNGMRDNLFCEAAKKYFQKYNKKFYSDIIFSFGNNEKKKLKKVISGKIYPLGATKNNFYYNKSKKRKKRIKNLIFISSAPIVKFKEDLILFRNAIKFCKRFKYNLYFIDRLKKNYKPYLSTYFNNDDYTYVSPKDSSETYKFFDQQNLMIFHHSSLGYEFLAKGFKSISFGHSSGILHHGLKNNYKQEGLFWSNKIDYVSFEKKILTILKYDTNRWKSKVSKYSNETMCYDKFNKNKKKIINNILKKKLNDYRFNSI